MNHNGFLAIILIYLMTMVPLFEENGHTRCQFLICASSMATSTMPKRNNDNFFTRFKERLNATMNFAESEYNLKTSETLNEIFNIASNVLRDAIKREEELKRNRAVKSYDENNFFESLHASSNSNTDTNDAPKMSFDGDVDVEGNDQVRNINEDAAKTDTDRDGYVEENAKVPYESSNSNIHLDDAANTDTDVDGYVEENAKVPDASSNSNIHSDDAAKTDTDGDGYAEENAQVSDASSNSNNDITENAAKTDTDEDGYVEDNAQVPDASSNSNIDITDEAKTDNGGSDDVKEKTHMTRNPVPNANQSTSWSDEKRVLHNPKFRRKSLRSKEQPSTAAVTKTQKELEQEEIVKNTEDASKLRATTRTNGLSDLQHFGREFKEGNDDSIKTSSSLLGSSNTKWRRKLQIDDGKSDLEVFQQPMPIFFEADQMNELIHSSRDEENDDEQKPKPGNGLGTASKYAKRRSADSTFPEVLLPPLVDPTANTNGINEAIKNANSLLAGGIPKPPDPVVPLPLGDPMQRFGKQALGLTEPTPITPKPGEINTANFTNVMEQVIEQLETIKECKDVDTIPPEASPCDISGSWNSEITGLQFHISMGNPSPSSRTFVDGKMIEIVVSERIPPRKHGVIECDWLFKGNTVKQVGGPFYITAQKADQLMVATFGGLCKICGGVPTIFGSWTFVAPANDCHDISLAFETKRDILHRDNLEAKRKHLRELKYAKNKCHAHGLTCG